MSRFPRLVAVLLPFLLLVARGVGQGTSGQLPEPIATVELIRLLDTYVEPRPDQWEAIESLHDDYRDEFRALREGDMERFLTEDLRRLQAGGMPTKTQLEGYVRRMDAIEAKVKALDDRLFDGIAALLDEKQLAGLPRARDARDRRRSRTMISMGGGNQDVDVARMAMEAGFPPETLALLEPQLRAYEQQLTANLRNLADRTRKMMYEVMDTVEKAGFAGFSQEQMAADPERAQAMMQVVQQAFQDANRRVMETLKAISALHRKTYQQVRGQVTGEPAYAFRGLFLNEAYPEVGSDSSGTERLIRSSLASRRTPEATKTEIRAIYDAFVRSDDAFANEGMDLVDGFNETRNRMNFDQAAYEAHGNARTALLERRNRAAASYTTSLLTLMPDGRIAELDRTAARGGDIFARDFDPEAEPAVETVVEETERFVDAPGQDRPAPMGAAEVAALANALGLDAGPRAVLEQLHQDYLDRWTAEVEPAVEESLQAQQDTYRDGTVDAAALGRWIEARRRVRSVAESLDANFLADATAGLGDEVETTVRLARLGRALSLYGGTSLDYLGFSGAVEAPVNLAHLVDASGPLEVEAAEPARAALLARSEALLSAYRDGFVRSLDLERQMQELSANYQRQAQDPGRQAAAAAEFGRQAQEVAAETETIRTRRAQVLRESFDAMLAALPEEDRPALQMAFDRAAYPSVYRDPRSALPLLDRAAALPDLDATQRERLEALRTRYAREYADFCRRMTPERSALGQAPRERFDEYMALENARAKVRFDRDERSIRAVSQLRRILTPEQAARIPGLDAYVRSIRRMGPS